MPFENRVLRVDAGFNTAIGRRAENQDYVGIHGGDGSDDTPRACIAVAADGVSRGAGGRVAAELAVRQFIDALVHSNPTLGVARNAARAIHSINGWINAVGRSDPRLDGAATTLTALVLQGRSAHVLHVGDTRAYLLRGERLTRLTEDHTLRQPEREHVLIRAIGLEPDVRVDHRVQSLRAHDRLLLCSDGVHGVLPDTALRTALLARRTAGEDARRIVEAALQAGSQDNLSCVVIDVLAVAGADVPELQSHFAALPILPPPRSGELLDGFRIGELLSDGRYSRLLRATDIARDAQVVLKFPQPDVAAATTYHLAFLREAWVGARLHSPWIGETIELPPERQSRLYSVMAWYAGRTLEQRLGETRIGLAEGVRIAQKLARAVAVLHRAGIIHRDIKPDNVLLEDGGGLRLLDLGVVRLPNIEEFPAQHIPGTPSYMAPELFEGQPGDEASDQYALGVTLYRMFSARYPYGEIEPFSRPRFQRATPLARHRPDLPAWLHHLVGRATAAQATERYGDVLELALELENGMAGGEPRPTDRPPLYQRNPLLFWKTVSALLALALVATIGLLPR